MARNLFFLSRDWLGEIARGYAQATGLAIDDQVQEVNRDSVKSAISFLKMAPWHFRFIVGGVEITASCFCLAYRLAYRDFDPAGEMKAFEKVPVIAAPLLRVYRSLVALAWFESSTVCERFGVE